MADTAETPAAAAVRFAGVLEQQLILYCAVRELALKSKELIAAKDTNGLMQVLAEKQDKIGEIDLFGEETARLRDIWEQTREGLPEEVRAPVEKVVEDLRAVLADIVAIEDEGQKDLLEAKSGAGAEIARLQKGKALHKAYGGGKPLPDARFKDKKM